MSVKLRLQRKGKPKEAHYRLVAVDSRQSRDGQELEILGYYNPKNAENRAQIHKTRVDYWISVGAQLSPTVKSLLGKATNIDQPAAS
jgi:small subunit ribosomal protein S16